MSLRRRLFLLLGGLICLLLVGQWLLVRSLTQAVAEDVRTVAFRVGEEILSGFSYRTESRTYERSSAPSGVASAAVAPADPGAPAAPAAPAAPPNAAANDFETHVVIVTSEPRTVVADAPPADEKPEQRLVMHRELRFRTPDGATVLEARGSGNELPESELRKIVLETDAARDVLFVRSPAMKRAIPIPHAEIASTLERFRSQLLLGNLALLGAGLLGAAYVAHRLTRPLARLTEAAERLGSGELGAAVELGRREGPEPDDPHGDRAQNDEIGRAIGAFNRMSQRLAELDRENRRLASVEQLSELGEVARGLAHSLRNPLNALGLAIEQAGAPAEIVEGSRRQIRRMDGALRSFLALASAGSAQAEPVDLAQLAREVALEALQDGAGRVRIEVEAAMPPIGAPPIAPLTVSGVPAELKAVLQALVVNAVEASPEGGKVRISLSRGEPGEVRIQIEDEGDGLPEAVRARLFEPHVTTKPHGSGMGLFLAQRLVSGRYSGDLRLEAGGAGATGATRATGTIATLRLGNRAR